MASLVVLVVGAHCAEGGWSYEVTSAVWKTGEVCPYGLCSPWCEVVPDLSGGGSFRASCWEYDGKYPDYIRLVITAKAAALDLSWPSWITPTSLDAPSAQTLDLLASLRPTAVWITVRNEEYGQTRTSLEWNSGPCPRDHDDSRGWKLANWSGQPWVFPDGVLYVLPETRDVEISFDLTLWDGGCNSGNDDPVYESGRVVLRCRTN
jgi:hypothetical protein